MTLKINISEPNTLKLLLDSIEGYRVSNQALDDAIEKENWGAISVVQGLRTMHASTIALIVNQYADSQVGGAH
ncbi:hypothetical protein ALQ72_03600 [Pseudomonas syringae pv. maculicola]|uniref:Uncharacterized protein n=1 Tax=Pseudomonas syringae pv. maculicola TaxID=59511 RepID=A0A3M6BEX8_PSEYM|nr:MULTISPECIES: hypothetical protein [Pseudomonas syringae group]MBM0209651.1 hypothetical protein [Pseudomonas syringae pv. maculicola]RMM81757.1 hypothetical protein ALQ72_03600 [Pseudomonas syringae pv. maculicola]RMV30032.1 hypothetical protein ALP13_102045 [Pseudomonas syringae pv. maculicola]